MSRVKIQKGQQRIFLNRIAKYFNFDWSKIAKISHICDRTLRDWRRERYNMSYKALLRLYKVSNISIPKIVKILPEYWSTKKASGLGAIRRNELYGNPGTLEGRRKGGLTTWRRYRFDPQGFIDTEFIGPKDINYPLRSPLLAELIGIILGDGAITKYQVVISLNNKTDREYAYFVSRLFRKLFNLKAVSRVRDKNTCSLVISSIKLTEFLTEIGLKIGNKIRQQVNIPKWILKNRNFRIACVRGLMDTDGSFYSYKHRVNGKRYKNYALDFTNRSLPLLQAVEDILRDLGCAPTLAKYKVLLYKKNDIGHYVAIVGSSNPNTKKKFKNEIF